MKTWQWCLSLCQQYSILHTLCIFTSSNTWISAIVSVTSGLWHDVSLQTVITSHSVIALLFLLSIRWPVTDTWPALLHTCITVQYQLVVSELIRVLSKTSPHDWWVPHTKNMLCFDLSDFPCGTPVAQMSVLSLWACGRTNLPSHSRKCFFEHWSLKGKTYYGRKSSNIKRSIAFN